MTNTPKAPPKGTAAYDSWKHRYGTLADMGNNKAALTKAFKAKEKRLTAENLANADAYETALAAAERSKAGLYKLNVKSYAQSGTTATITLNSAVPTGGLNQFKNGHLIYIRHLDGVVDATFSGDSNTSTPRIMEVTSVSGSVITATVYNSKTVSTTASSGQVFYNHRLANETAYLINLDTQWNTYKTKFAEWLKVGAQLQSINSDLRNATSGISSASGISSGSSDTTNSGSDISTLNADTSEVYYNIPSVTWAYFSSNVADTSGGSGYSAILLNDGGGPASTVKVTNANQLWLGANTGAHKGMFQTYSYWKNKSNTAKDSKYKDPNLPDWYYSSNYQSSKYGFQFLYNPGTVTMGWGGTPTVDPGLIMSGKDVTPYITPSQTSSYISFDLLLNRMPDMSVLNSLGPNGVANHLSSIYGIDGAQGNSQATNTTTYLDELKIIQNLGTMYDIEYLLSTLVGFREFSALRGRYTADFGFLMGLPVELHLGKDMRYIGTIMDFTVTHTIFGAGMVPLFTNVSITFARRVEPFRGPAQIKGNGSLLTGSAANSPRFGTGGQLIPQ